MTSADFVSVLDASCM